MSSVESLNLFRAWNTERNTSDLEECFTWRSHDLTSKAIDLVRANRTDSEKEFANQFHSFMYMAELAEIVASELEWRGLKTQLEANADAIT
jgi:hypothetical protein